VQDAERLPALEVYCREEKIFSTISVRRCERARLLEVVCRAADRRHLSTVSPRSPRGGRTFVARITLAWITIRLTIEEKPEPINEESKELLVRFAPHVAAMV